MKRRTNVRKEFLISKRYILRKKKISCLRYILTKTGNFYGIKVTLCNNCEKEKSEVLLPENTKKEVMYFIKALAKNISFPIELKYILSDLNNKN